MLSFHKAVAFKFLFLVQSWHDCQQRETMTPTLIGCLNITWVRHINIANIGRKTYPSPCQFNIDLFKCPIVHHVSHLNINTMIKLGFFPRLDKYRVFHNNKDNIYQTLYRPPIYHRLYIHVLLWTLFSFLFSID